MAARHKTLVHSMTYQRDAIFLLALAENNGLKLPISEWKPIFCKDLQIGRSINSSNLQNFKSIPISAEIFERKSLDIKTSHPQRCVNYIIKEAIRYNCPTTTKQRIEEILSTVDAEKARELQYLFEKYAAEVKRSENVVIPTAVQPELDERVTSEVIQPKAKRVRGGDFNLDDREGLES